MQRWLNGHDDWNCFRRNSFLSLPLLFDKEYKTPPLFNLLDLLRQKKPHNFAWVNESELKVFGNDISLAVFEEKV